jgi:hypothetical protein
MIPPGDVVDLQAALDIPRRYPGRVVTRIRGKVFGGLSVEEGHVYSSPIHVPAT